MKSSHQCVAVSKDLSPSKDRFSAPVPQATKAVPRGTKGNQTDVSCREIQGHAVWQPPAPIWPAHHRPPSSIRREACPLHRQRKYCPREDER
eukprot:3466382-Rhodomonas_salina.3